MTSATLLSKKAIRVYRSRFISILLFLIFPTVAFAETPKDKSPLEGNFTQSIMGQALINANPRSPKGYELLATFQRAHSQWRYLLRTVESAERQGILDPVLYRHKAAAFLALGYFPECFTALEMAEVRARYNDQ